MFCSDDSDEEYFANTHFNCIPVLAMECYQSQYYCSNDSTTIGDDLNVHLAVQSIGDSLNTHASMQCGMAPKHEHKLNKSSSSNEDVCNNINSSNNNDWSSMGFTFTKNNGECGGSDKVNSYFIVNKNNRYGSDTSSVSCGSIDNHFSDITSVSCCTNMNSSIDSISCDTSTNNNIIEPLSAPQHTAQLPHNNKINHRKHITARRRKRKRHQHIAKNNFFPMKHAINDLVYYSHKYGNNVGVTKTSLDGIKFLIVNHKNRIVKLHRKIKVQKVLNNQQTSNFYPLTLLIDSLIEMDIKYGNRIGINKQSYGKLRMLFIGYSRDEISEVITG